MMQRTPPPDAGFTMVETLVALFILSMLSVAGGSLLLRATDTGRQLQDREAAIREIDIAQAFIREDVGAITARAWERPDAAAGLQTLTGGTTARTDALLSFVRNGWINPAGTVPRSSLQTVRYILTETGELVRETWLRPDPTASTPQARRVLLENVEAVTLSFWRGGEPSTYWEGTPLPPANGLPELIEFQIVLEGGRTLTIAARTGESVS